MAKKHKGNGGHGAERLGISVTGEADLPPCTRGATAAGEAIATQVGALRAQEAAVRHERAEGIHDMRVASRRLSRALSEFGPVSSEAAVQALQGRVGTVTKSLGRPRELDVMIAMLTAERAHTNGSARAALNFALRQLRARRRAAAEQCAAAVAQASGPEFEAEYHAVLDGIEPSGECHQESATRQLGRQYKRLCKRYKKWRASGADARLHRLRIAFKKMRYACELYAPLYGKTMERFLTRLRSNQDLLGDWQDCRVLIEELEPLAAEAPTRAVPGFPELAEVFIARKEKLLRTFKRRAPRFFSKSARKTAKRLFCDPGTVCCRAGVEKPEERED
jgi:CHAD domain-containing protein